MDKMMTQIAEASPNTAAAITSALSKALTAVAGPER
jgi:hypothetical protein